MTDAVSKHFVTFYSPGTFMPEETTKEVDAWSPELALAMAADIVERHGARPYAFRFTTRSRGPDDLDSKVSASSGLHYFGCDVLTLAEVKATYSNENILIGNMERNDIARVAVPREGWKGFYPVSSGDVVLPTVSS